MITRSATQTLGGEDENWHDWWGQIVCQVVQLPPEWKYCWWFKNRKTTTWDVSNFVHTGITTNLNCPISEPSTVSLFWLKRSVVRTFQPLSLRTRARSKPLFSSIYLQRVSWKTMENQWVYKIEVMNVIALECKKNLYQPLLWLSVNFAFGTNRKLVHVSIFWSGLAKVPSWFGRSTRFRTWWNIRTLCMFDCHKLPLAWHLKLAWHNCQGSLFRTRTWPVFQIDANSKN